MYIYLYYSYYTVYKYIYIYQVWNVSFQISMALASPCHGQVIFPLKCVSQLLVTCVLIGSQCDRHCQPECQTRNMEQQDKTLCRALLMSLGHKIYDDMISLISLIYYLDLHILWISLGWRARENSQLGQLSTNLRFTLQLSSTTKCLRGVGCCSPVQPLC